MLWNANGNSYAIYQVVPLSVTLNKMYHHYWQNVPSLPDDDVIVKSFKMPYFKGMPLFDVDYVRKSTR